MLAGNVVYRISIEDRDFDRGLDRAAANAAAAGATSGAAFTRAMSGALHLGPGIDRELGRVESRIRNFGSSMESIFTGVFQGIGFKISDILIGSIGNVVSGIGSQLQRLGGFIYDVGGSSEKLKVAFDTIIGDAAKSKKLMEELQELSVKTPYTTSEITGSAQALLSNFKPDQITEQIRRLGDVASGVNKPLKQILDNYSQVMTLGKAQAEELRQFGEAGVPIYDELAKMIGVNKSEIADLGSKGLITSKMITQAFKNMTDEGGKFYNMMDAQSKTLQGQVSTVVDSFEVVAKNIFDAVNPALKTMLGLVVESGTKAAQSVQVYDDIGRAANNIANYLKQNPEIIDSITQAAARLLNEGVNQLVAGTDSILKYLKENPKAIDQAIAAAGKLLAEVKSILGVFVGWGKELAAFNSTAQAMADELDKAHKAAVDTGRAFRGWLDSIDRALASLHGVIPKFFGEFLKEGNVVAGQFQQAFSKAFTNPIEAAKNAITGVFNGAGGPMPSGPSVNGGKYHIADPRDSDVTSYGDSSDHHTYQRTSRGVAKDLTIFQNGSSKVPVPSPVAGKVLAARDMGRAGNAVIILDTKGQQTLLGHFASLMVKAGQQVSRGQTLGIQGSTGRSTGTHTHIEAKENILQEYYKSLRTGNWGVGNKLGGSGGPLQDEIKAARDAAGAKKNKDAEKAQKEQERAAKKAQREQEKKQKEDERALKKARNEEERARIKANRENERHLEEEARKLERNRDQLGSLTKGVSPVQTEINDLSRLGIQDSNFKQIEDDVVSLQHRFRSTREELTRLIKDQSTLNKSLSGKDLDQGKANLQQYNALLHELGQREQDAIRTTLTDKFADQGKGINDMQRSLEQLKGDFQENTPENSYADAVVRIGNNVDDMNAKLLEAINYHESLQALMLANGASEQSLAKNAGNIQQLMGMRSQLPGVESDLIARAKAERDRQIKERDKQEAEEKRSRILNATRLNQERFEDTRTKLFGAIDASRERKRQVSLSDTEELQTRANAATNPDEKLKLDRAVRYRQLQDEHADRMTQINEFARTGQYTNAELDKMRLNAEKVNAIKLDQVRTEFKSLGDTILHSAGEAFGSFLHDVITGNQSIGESFRNMIGSITSMLAKMAIQRLLGGVFGGGIMNFAEGGVVGQSMKRERGESGGRDPVVVVANKDERILNADETRRYNQLEKRGLRNFASGGFVSNMPSFSPTAALGGGDMQINIPITFEGQSGANVQKESLKALRGELEQAVTAVIIKHKTASGGLLK